MDVPINSFHNVNLYGNFEDFVSEIGLSGSSNYEGSSFGGKHWHIVVFISNVDGQEDFVTWYEGRIEISIFA